jgi:PAS domain S-box-containing protein
LLLDMCDIDKKNIVKSVETSFISKGKREISIIFSSSAMYDKYGNIQDFVCVAKDITERKRTEEKILSSERQLNEAQRIAHIGSWELNIQTGELKWSDESYRMFGLKPQEFGATYEFFLNAIHPDDRDFVNSAYTDSLKYHNPYNIIHRLFRTDGSIKIVHERCETVYDENGKPILSLGTVQDITERKLAEDQIEQSLREKEVLLREIHHRVKNNMQIISSLLSHQMENIKDNKIIDIFTESQNRILSMSLVHEKLYQSRDLRNIDLKDYINDLGVNLFQSYEIHSGNIRLNIDVEDILLDIDLAIPIGLILNELITNSLKYAFPDGMKGEIKVLFRSTNDNMLELVVNDNGIGLPEDLDFRKTRTLGLHLVTVLAENQLHGKIEMNRFKGTEFRIKFRGRKS